MRLLLYASSFAPDIGGVETCVLHLVQGLTAGEFPVQVTVATRSRASSDADATSPFRVVRRPGWLALWKLVGEADLVHVAGPALGPLLLARLRRRPVVVEHHGYQAACPNGLLLFAPERSICPGHFQARRYRLCLACNRRALGRLGSLRALALSFPRRRLCRDAGANVGVSEHVVRRLGLPSSRAIQHGVPTPAAEASAFAAREPGALVVASVGRLVAEKGLSLLLEAAARLGAEGRRLQVRIVGDGPERDALAAQARALGLGDAVTFTGWLRGAALHAALSDVPVLVMPSIWEEAAGLAAIEQMMRGRLVVAARVGGLAEVLGDAGLTFPPGDAAALAACLRRACDEAGLVERLGRRARARALERFSQARMAAEHRRLYDEVLAAGGRARP
jgi:glycosyltransferase involved in cell wall biosynthesis